MPTDLDQFSAQPAGTSPITAVDNPPSGQPLVQQVRELVAEAAAAGRPTPGRPTLVRLTGATDHQVRRAMAILTHETTGHTMPTPDGETAPTDDPQHTAEARRAPANSRLAPPQTDGGDPGDATPAASATMTASRPSTEHPTHPGAPTTRDDCPCRADGPARSPGGRPPTSWPLLLIGLGAAVAVWSGWVGLGQLTGFGVVQLLPGIWDDLRINTAVVLPLSVEAYGGYALRCWLSTSLSPRTRRFAKRSAITSLTIGAGAQAAYHLMTATGIHTAPWPVTVLVACIPVLVLGLASALARLVAADTMRIYESE